MNQLDQLPSAADVLPFLAVLPATTGEVAFSVSMPPPERACSPQFPSHEDTRCGQLVMFSMFTHAYWLSMC